MAVVSRQLVFIRHLEDFVYLSGIDQMVTTHDRLVLRDRHRDIVEMIHLDQAAAANVEESGLAQRLADIGIVRRNLQSHRVVASRFESTLRRLAVRQQTAHGNDRQHTDDQAEKSGDSRGQDVHGLACLLLVESADNEVRRRTNEGTHTAHARGITQGNEQF